MKTNLSHQVVVCRSPHDKGGLPTVRTQRREGHDETIANQSSAEPLTKSRSEAIGRTLQSPGSQQNQYQRLLGANNSLMDAQYNQVQILLLTDQLTDFSEASNAGPGVCWDPTQGKTAI